RSRKKEERIGTCMAEKKTENKEEKIEDALLKVALGYQISEVTEEYAEVDGELKLTKRKKTKKDVPPDLKAVQMLLATDGGEEYGGWSDEELEKEKERLLATLKMTEKTKKEGGMVEVKVKKTKSTVKKKTAKKKTAKAKEMK
nr:hypothetical protein [Clostridia bacterium]